MSYTRELLGRLFENERYAHDFEAPVPDVPYDHPENRREEFHNARERVKVRLARLQLLIDKLPLIGEQSTAVATEEGAWIPPKAGASRKVFIVHGHDSGVREAVSRLCEKLGLEVIVLHEKPNEGRTIIEKFEKHADVAFAIVLFTADDSCTGPGGGPPRARARQNVVLEMGFFLGRLGRRRVCALYQSGVEIPSDYSGVLYVPWDTAGGWRLLLAKELREAGLPVDLNLV